MLGVTTRSPSISTPLPPKKLITEQFCKYGEVVINTLVLGKFVYPALLVAESSGLSNDTANLNVAIGTVPDNASLNVILNMYEALRTLNISLFSFAGLSITVLILSPTIDTLSGIITGLSTMYSPVATITVALSTTSLDTLYTIPEAICIARFIVATGAVIPSLRSSPFSALT